LRVFGRRQDHKHQDFLCDQWLPHFQPEEYVFALTLIKSQSGDRAH
jgi:hypothetical protein